MTNPPKKTGNVDSTEKNSPSSSPSSDKGGGGARKAVPAPKGAKLPSSSVGVGSSPLSGKKIIKPPSGLKGAPVPGFIKKEQAKTAGQADSKKQAPQQVRIVLDDSKVSEQEVGTKGFAKKYGAMIGLLIVGLIIGFTAGGTNVTNKLYNQTIRDGKSILEKVTSSQDEIKKAVSLLDQILKASQGAGKEAPSIDNKALEQLLNIKKPFSAADFSRKNYSNFKSKTVDALFVFNASIERGWQSIAKAVGVSRLRKDELAKGLEALKATNGKPPSGGKIDQELFLYLNFQKDLLEARELLSLAQRVGEKLQQDLKTVAEVGEVFSL